MTIKKDSRLDIRLPEEELEQIRKNAEACNKTVSGYIREVALNMCVLSSDNENVIKHTNEISAYRNSVNQLIFTIKKTGNYTPVDLEYILDKTIEILKSEKEFLRTFNKFVESEKKIISRNVKNIVKEQLAKKK